MNRREFLVSMLSFAFLTESCASSQKLPQGAKPVLTETVKRPEDYKKKAITEINALPGSDVKNVLQSRVVPLLETPTPFKINLSGVDIWFSRVTMQEQIVRGNITDLNASYNERKTIAELKYHPVTAFETAIPLLGAVRPFELSKLPRANVLADGTPVTRLNVTPQDVIDKSLSPNISIAVQWDGGSISAQYVQSLITWGYIKESCSFLLDVLRMEEVIRKMEQLGLPTNVDAKDQYGNLENITIIPEAFAVINKQRGRSLALLDLAGYLVSLKVLSTTSTFQLLVESGAMDKSLVPLIANASLGNTEQDIFYKSYEWALNTPAAQKFGYKNNSKTLNLCLQ